MHEMQHILVPVDFKTHSDLQANFALYMAKLLNAHTTFIHVLPPIADFSDYDPATLEQVEEKLLAQVQKKLADFIRKLDKSGLVCDGVVLRGSVADAIISSADEQNADLVILSTHGALGIEKVLLGSVADRVIKGVNCPCLVFNPYKNKWRYDDKTGQYDFGKAVELPPLA